MWHARPKSPGGSRGALRYFLVIVRDIFLKGVGLETFWPEALALLAWGVGIVILATLRSSKRLA